MAEIPLTRGKFAIVDDADAPTMLQSRWHAIPSKAGNWYASRGAANDAGRRVTLYMHRVLLEPLRGIQIDHINGNGLDNRRSNLRFATHSQNNVNSRRALAASGYRGVYQGWGGKFVAAIQVNGKIIQMGTHAEAETAAHVYDDAARKYFGEFARLNFPA